MTTDRWRQVQALFHEALEQEGEDRNEFLERSCPDDQRLLSEVRELLSGHSASGRFDRLVGDLTPALALGNAQHAAPDSIGPYRVLRTLGQGGMGTVFLAERADGQFEHRVALKLLRHDLPDESLHHRFLAERQILARLEHPNIARLFDGGLTENGRPYYVMEYVEGLPIDEYCDLHRLGLRLRLDLFRTVCSAVHYAHRHLVVHRDLKPRNILVADDGTPKLLDFGIAKLLDPTVVPQSVAVTATGMWVLTPDYASPEQVRGDDVTTASDVYQLAVLLYELLTGHKPYRIRSRSIQDVTRAVCETEPDRPSTVVGRSVSVTRGDGSTAEITPEMVGRARRSSAERLSRRLRGDLDTILMLALRKEPERRYGSVEQFSEDIRRLLEDLPVAARKDTVWYRASRFVRRNRVAVAATLAIVALLATFAATLIRQERQTARERDKAEHVASLLVDLFKVSEPGEALGNTVTAREILDRGAERIRTELRTEPEVQATMMDVIGRVYVRLGLYDQARPLLEESLALRRGIFAAVSPEVATGLLAMGLLSLEEGDLETAVELYRQALDMRLLTLGEPHAEIAAAKFSLANALAKIPELDEAERLTREALETRRDLYGDVHQEVASNLQNLALIHQLKGDNDSAEALYRQVIEMKKEIYGSAHPDLAVTITNLGWLLRANGDLGAAEELLREALEMRRTIYGERHPYLARALSALAALLLDSNRLDEAESLTQEALEMRRKMLGPRHPDLADDLYSLARVAQARGNLEQAESLLMESIDLDDRPDTALALSSLAGVKKDQGKLDEAEATFRESWAIYKENLGEQHPFAAIVQSYIAALLKDRDRFEESEVMYRQATQRLEAAWGEDHPRAIRTTVELGVLLNEMRRPTEAEPLLRDALERIERSIPDDNAAITGTKWALASCLAALERYEDAENLFTGIYDWLSSQEATPPERLARILQELVDLYEAWGKANEASLYKDRLDELAASTRDA